MYSFQVIPFLYKSEASLSCGLPLILFLYNITLNLAPPIVPLLPPLQGGTQGGGEATAGG